MRLRFHPNEDLTIPKCGYTVDFQHKIWILAVVHWFLRTLMSATIFSAQAGLLSTAHAQTSQNRPQVPQCQIFEDQVIYHASGYHFQGRVKFCPLNVPGVTPGLYDITPAPNQIKPSERLFMSQGRFEDRRRDAFIRAKPNTSYVIPPTNDGYADWAITNIRLREPYSMADANIALPFYPTKVYYREKFRGVDIYSYGDLFIFDSKRHDAYPLNENSMIISNNGYTFGSPDTLAMLLQQSIPPIVAARYTEINYYQTDESPVIFRRAFIPIYNRSDLNPEWSALSRKHPIISSERAPDSSNNMLPDQKQVARFLAIGAMIGLIVAFGRSTVGSRLYASMVCDHWELEGLHKSKGDCIEDYISKH
jgi:hypothetical protein